MVRSLFDRILGIASIQIQTAGQSVNNAAGYEGVILGLAEWDSILTDLRAKLKSATRIDTSAVNITSEPDLETNVQDKILGELVRIRKALEK